jgi:spore maturation protein CgeB
MFYHSLVSDWNHGNAHFLRGVAVELQRRGHQVVVHEPENAWSRMNLLADAGEAGEAYFHSAYPSLTAHPYDPSSWDPEETVRDADLVIVHEWNDHALVRRIGELRKRHSFTLLFHDTHHRLITDPEAMKAYDLRHYDGVLAFGDVLRDLYLSTGLAERAWTWHEAADTSRFSPRPGTAKERDLIWVGNWGDDERTAELREFLIEPVKRLGLKAALHGVRYPEHALAELSEAGIDYLGWLPNSEVPEAFARSKVTVHVPRRPYANALPGIPTIRPFEAMACGIPMVSAPWQDSEGLFNAGRDHLVARDGAEMEDHLRRLLGSETLRAELAAAGLATICSRHTCRHRVSQLFKIYAEVLQERADLKKEPVFQ